MHTESGKLNLYGLSVGVMVYIYAVMVIMVLFYTVQTVFSIGLHLNLALTGDFLKKTNSV